MQGSQSHLAHTDPPAKMPYWWLDPSRSRLQVQPFQQRHRESRRSHPAQARAKAKDGERHNPTKITRAPPCAMSVAIAAARLDLPSLAKHDVKPMTFVTFALPFKSTVSFIDRMASAYGDDGESMIVRMTFGLEEMLLGSAPRATANCAFLIGSMASGLPTR